MATKIRFNAVDRTLYSMLTENTGNELLDSGNFYGRMWERNKKLTIEDFHNAPEVVYKDGFYAISFFHHFRRNLAITRLCTYFNSVFVKDQDINHSGYSIRGERWLLKKGFEVLGTGNSYNFESNLSQLYQYTNLIKDSVEYILLQSHQGCDVRGGYSNARLFVVESNISYEGVYGRVIREDGTEIEIDNYSRGTCLTNADSGDETDIGPNDKVELFLP